MDDSILSDENSLKRKPKIGLIVYLNSIQIVLW